MAQIEVKKSAFGKTTTRTFDLNEAGFPVLFDENCQIIRDIPKQLFNVAGATKHAIVQAKLEYELAIAKDDAQNHEIAATGLRAKCEELEDTLHCHVTGTKSLRMLDQEAKDIKKRLAEIEAEKSKHACSDVTLADVETTNE